MRPQVNAETMCQGAAVRRQRSIGRIALRVGGTVAAILALVVVVPLVLVEIDETAVPSISQVDLPDGVNVDQSSVGCASGGCWLEVRLDTSGRREGVLDQLLAMDGTCPAVGALDRRRVCIDSASEGGTSFYLSYKRSLGL